METAKCSTKNKSPPLELVYFGPILVLVSNQKPTDQPANPRSFAKNCWGVQKPKNFQVPREGPPSGERSSDEKME